MKKLIEVWNKTKNGFHERKINLKKNIFYSKKPEQNNYRIKSSTWLQFFS